MMSRMINAHTRLNKALDLHPQVLDYSVSLNLPPTRGLGVKRTTVHSLVKSLGITRSGKGEISSSDDTSSGFLSGRMMD